MGSEKMTAEQLLDELDNLVGFDVLRLQAVEDFVRDSQAENERLREALIALRRGVTNLVWEPMGETGDESDWFRCQLCGARTRGSGGHITDCPMARAEAALRSVAGKEKLSPHDIRHMEKEL